MSNGTTNTTYNNYRTNDIISIDPSEYLKLGSWTSNGTPNYLTTRDPTINLTTIERIINTVPEGVNEVQKNPSYFMNPTPRTLMISSSDLNFNGADVYVSFVYEGAGYTNTLGYYWFDISQGNTHPITTDSNGNKIALDYNYLIDPTISSVEAKRRRALLHKTIIFPNGSGISGALSTLPKGYTSTNYGGGTLNYGDTVQIFYDVNNKSRKWPNNTAIGLFVISNGWGGSSIKTSTAEHLHTDNTLNPKPTNKNFTDASNILPCDSTGFVQSITMSDLLNSNNTSGYTLVSFEDILRNGGDRDTNDCVACFRYTPATAASNDGRIILSNNTTLNNSYTQPLNLNNTQMQIDKTGSYIVIPANSITYFGSTSISPFNTYKQYKLVVEINVANITRYNKLIPIFDKINYDYSGIATFDNTNKKITVTLIVNKYDMQINMYIFKASKNQNILNWSTDINEKRTLLAAYQQDYVTYANDIIQITGYNINYYTSTNDNNTDFTIYKNTTTTLSTVNFTPFAMGDPHITTVYGELIELPHSLSTVTFFNDQILKIDISLEYNPNNTIPEYNTLVFMNNIIITYNDNIYNISLFNLESFISDSSILTEILEINYTDEMKRRIASLTRLYNTDVYTKYISINTDHLGKVILECTKIHLEDVVSLFSIISDNILLSNGEGIFMSPADLLYI